jgi:EAL domain-containing protein (putative c-di-GMP-specific phosphodiesterase class I)
MSEIETSSSAKAIIRAVMALSKSLHIPALAEGVETEGQLSIVDREGCPTRRKATSSGVPPAWSRLSATGS